MWSVDKCETCQPRTEADGQLVTESNLSLRVPARVAAVMIGRPIVRRPSPLRPELVVMALVARALGQVLACLAHRGRPSAGSGHVGAQVGGVVRVAGLGAVAERGDGG